MEKRTISCDIHIAKSLETLTTSDQELVKAARAALELSYSPYSNFKVGAAALLEDGTIVKGANQENAAYPMCICAERSVLSITSNSYMGKKVVVMAIVVYNPNQKITVPASPCGACRQVLSETEDRQKAPIRLLLTSDIDETWILNSAKDLLPLSFGGDLLS